MKSKLYCNTLYTYTLITLIIYTLITLWTPSQKGLRMGHLQNMCVWSAILCPHPLQHVGCSPVCLDFCFGVIKNLRSPSMDCSVVWWLAPSCHSKRVPGLTPTWGLSVWSLHVLPVYAWVLSGYSGFLSPSKNMHVRLIGVSKIVLGVSVSVWPCDGLATCPGCTPSVARWPLG